MIRNHIFQGDALAVSRLQKDDDCPDGTAHRRNPTRSMGDTMKQQIRRADHGADPFFRMARATAQDTNLSYDALGVIAYLLSKPADWRVQPPDLERTACKREKIYRILRELIAAGYMERIIHRDAKGRTSEVEYILHELKHPLAENPYTDKPEAEKQHITYKREEHTKDIAAGKPPRKPDSIFDALAAQVFGVTVVTPEFGGRIAKLRKSLVALEPDAPDADGGRLASDIFVFVTWYKAAYPGASVPRDSVKFLEHWQAWRESTNGMSSFESALRGMKIEEYKP